MKQAYTAALAIAIALAGCTEKENKVEVNKVDILNMNHDSLTVSVDGKDLFGFRDARGSVYLTSGEYKIGVKDSTGALKLEMPVKMDARTYKNENNVHVLNVDDSKSYVLLNVKAAYFPGKEYTVVGKYFNLDYFDIELGTFHFYWPWSILPDKIYAVEGKTANIYKLIEVPSDYKDKSDEEIIAYCEDKI